MKKLRLLMWFLFIVLISGGCLNGKAVENTQKPNPAHLSFVTRQELYSFLATSGRTGTVTGRIMGAVLPHHLTAGEMIAGVIAELVVQKPRVIIIAGPNHDNAGAQVITGYYDWQTPDGIIKADPAIVRALLTGGVAEHDEEVLSREHAIGSILPFIRHYLPETKIVPLILHHGVTPEQVDAILAVFEPYLGEDVVFLASVDFSHYLSRRQAYDRDEVTLQAMRAWDFTKLYRMNSEYLDSPASLSLVLRAAQNNGISEFQLFDHRNSGDILKNELIETTSYFTLLFAKP